MRRPACWSRRKWSQWAGLFRFGLVQPDPVRGLSSYGLSDTWSGLVWSNPAWSGLIWSDLIWYLVCVLSGVWPVRYAACQVTGICPGLVWFSLVQSDPVCLACPIANCQGAASTSTSVRRQRQRRRGPASRVSVWVMGLWGSVSVAVVRLWGCMVVVSVECVCACGICGLYWCVSVVVGGLVCGGWIGAEICGCRSLVSSNSKSVLCMVGA